MDKGSNPFDDATDFDESDVEDTAIEEEKVGVEPSNNGLQESASAETSISEYETEDVSDHSESEEPEDSLRPVEKSAPAFPFSDCNKGQLYIREETENGLSDFKHDVKGELRRSYGVRNPELREIDEAIIVSLLDQMSSEQIASVIIEKRGYRP